MNFLVFDAIYILTIRDQIYDDSSLFVLLNKQAQDSVVEDLACFEVNSFCDKTLQLKKSRIVLEVIWVSEESTDDILDSHRSGLSSQNAETHPSTTLLLVCVHFKLPLELFV